MTQQASIIDHPIGKNLIKFLEELNKESDRGKVLISCARLDAILEKLIRNFLVESDASSSLFEGLNAPLSSFSSKITMARSLGLISLLEYKELHTLRKIRNHFAHEVHASFSDEKIKSWCESLKLKAHDYASVTVPASGQFTTSAAGMIPWLDSRAYEIKNVRLTTRE